MAYHIKWRCFSAKRRKELGVERLGVAGYAAIVVALFLTLVPIYWIASMSIKPYGEWFSYPLKWIPSEISPESWIAIFNPRGAAEFRPQYEEFVAFIPAVKAVSDSAIIASTATALAVIIGLLAALAITRHRYGGDFFPMLLLAVIMFPTVVYVVPFLVLISSMGLYDTHLGLVLPYIALTAPYSAWMLRAFIMDVPRELEEAAMTDGLSALSSLFKVTIPLIKGGIAATALFIFILNWSEYMLALTLTHGNVIPIPILMARYVRLQEASAFYGPQAALSLIAIVPVVIMGIIIRKYLVVGATFGAVRRGYVA